MLVQPATVDDIPALCTLLDHLFAQEAEFTPDRAAQTRGLAAIVTNPSVGAILIARDGNEALGMVNLLWTVSTALGARVALLEDMVVTPAARGRGIGGQLLNAAVAHARGEGCRRVTLLTDGDNLRAQAFYRANGFTASAMQPYRLLLD